MSTHKSKIILVKYINTGNISILELMPDFEGNYSLEDIWELNNGYVLASEITEVAIDILPDEVILKDSLISLDNASKKLDAEYQVQKDNLEATKRNLLSLTQEDYND